MLVANTNADLMTDSKKAIAESLNTEVIISLTRSGLPHSTSAPGELPPPQHQMCHLWE